MSISSLLGPRGCLFTFHRVAPSALWKTLPNRDFFIDLEFFDRLITYLRRTGWKFVTIDEALRRAGCADSEDRYVNFSVDDGYRDTYERSYRCFGATVSRSRYMSPQGFPMEQFRCGGPVWKKPCFVEIAWCSIIIRST
jgi:hypothetical protein